MRTSKPTEVGNRIVKTDLEDRIDVPRIKLRIVKSRGVFVVPASEESKPVFGMPGRFPVSNRESIEFLYDADPAHSLLGDLTRGLVSQNHGGKPGTES